MLAALALKHFGVTDREFYLYDTYEGMTRPEAVDVDFDGNSMQQAWEQGARSGPADRLWRGGGDGALLYKDHRLSHGEDAFRGRRCAGNHSRHPARRHRNPPAGHRRVQIHPALADAHLYDRIAPGGVLIIDDYGWCRGARQATDEFFEKARFQAADAAPQSGRRLVIKP